MKVDYFRGLAAIEALINSQSHSFRAPLGDEYFGRVPIKQVLWRKKQNPKRLKQKAQRKARKINRSKAP